MNRKIYIDYAATSYIRQEVLNEMMPYLTEHFGNPSSAHSMSREVKKAIYEAKIRTAKALGANRDEVFFTSGGSESDNWAIKGVAFRNKDKGNHIITSKIEHHAVLNTCKYLEEQGFKVTYLPVDKDGMVRIDELEKAINSETILVSIMFANNEIGSIQPIKQIGDICKKRGIIFHTDAVQAVGHVPINVKDMNIDLLSLSGHKFYGPKGIGALYIKKGVKIHNLIHGGSQERAKRSGTENVAGIVGLGKAIELAIQELDMESKRLVSLRDKLIDGLLSIPNSKLNGPTGEERLPGNVNISFKDVNGEAMLIALDNMGICASSGSACTAGSIEPSHVLLSLGIPKDMVKGSIRFSMGLRNNEEDIDYLIKVIPEIVQKIRNLSSK
ncbi:cysteine desulfurase NifS [Clostridium sp. JNZ J1-5]